MEPLNNLTTEEISLLKTMRQDYRAKLISHFERYSTQQLAELAFKQPDTISFIGEYLEVTPNRTTDMKEFESALLEKQVETYQSPWFKRQ